MDKLKDIAIEFIGSDFFIYSMYVYLFLITVYVAYCILNYFKYNNKRIKGKFLDIYNQMSEQEKQRAEAERQQRDIHGGGLKKDMLQKLDDRLVYSGLKDKIKWLNTELFIVIILVVEALILIVFVTFKGPIVGITVAVMFYIAVRLIISLLATVRDRRVEASMIQFMNVIDNFSKSSDDIIQIFEKSSKFIDEPLGSQLYECVVEARSSGDASLALQELQDKVRNRHFRVLIGNLETSSKYETNYSEIIEDCRVTFHEHLKSEKEKRSMQLNGIVEILAMLASGVASIYLLGTFSEGGDVINLLLHGGILGKAIFVFLCITVVLSVYVCAFQIIKGKD